MKKIVSTEFDFELRRCPAILGDPTMEIRRVAYTLNDSGRAPFFVEAWFRAGGTITCEEMMKLVVQKLVHWRLDYCHAVTGAPLVSVQQLGERDVCLRMSGQLTEELTRRISDRIMEIHASLAKALEVSDGWLEAPKVRQETFVKMPDGQLLEFGEYLLKTFQQKNGLLEDQGGTR